METSNAGVLPYSRIAANSLFPVHCHSTPSAQFAAPYQDDFRRSAIKGTISNKGTNLSPAPQRLNARAGYQLGSRFKIYGSSDNIAIRLMQKGPIFGVEYHWGVR